MELPGLRYLHIVSLIFFDFFSKYDPNNNENFFQTIKQKKTQIDRSIYFYKALIMGFKLIYNFVYNSTSIFF